MCSVADMVGIAGTAVAAGIEVVDQLYPLVDLEIEDIEIVDIVARRVAVLELLLVDWQVPVSIVDCLIE
jgi:hypothetical protein